MLRLVVTGSRDFKNKSLVRQWIFEAVDEFRATSKELQYRPVDWTVLSHVTLIHGRARGFDSLAAEVARDCGMIIHDFPADWNVIDSAAGHSRNWEMIIKGKPNFGLVGPGQYGTGHMRGALIGSGIPFLDKSDQPIV